MKARNGTKPPVDHASRVYTLVPVDVEDAYAWAASRMAARGWQTIEQDYSITPHGEYVRVTHWAIPPESQAPTDTSAAGVAS